MKFAFIIFFSFISAQAMALEQAIITADKAVIVVQGPIGDMDAIHLYDAMNVAATDDATSSIKSLEHKSEDGALLLALSCKISKTIANYGSCTLSIYKSDFAILDHVNKEAYFMANDSDAWPIVPKFSIVDPDGTVFTSNSLKLSIKIDNAGFGSQSFRIYFMQ